VRERHRIREIPGTAIRSRHRAVGTTVSASRCGRCAHAEPRAQGARAGPVHGRRPNALAVSAPSRPCNVGSCVSPRASATAYSGDSAWPSTQAAAKAASPSAARGRHGPVIIRPVGQPQGRASGRTQGRRRPQQPRRALRLPPVAATSATPSRPSAIRCRSPSVWVSARLSRYRASACPVSPCP